MQTSESGFCGETGSGSYVYLYPEEYLTFAVEYPGIREDIPRMRMLPDGQVEYRITDHLASLRVSLDGTGNVTNQHDYEPYGDIITTGGEARQGFNSREKDEENGLFSNGVRKLDDGEGRFTSIDPLWEKFPGWSPYQYGYNNPISVTDPSGMQGKPSGSIWESVKNIVTGAATAVATTSTGSTGSGLNGMKASEKAIAYLKDWEGFSATPYPSAEGGTTIGYGEFLHNGPPTAHDMKTQHRTIEQADKLLRSYVKGVESMLNKNVTTQLSQGQFDALTIFVYNWTNESFLSSKCLQYLNKRDFINAAKEMDVINSDGVFLPGLLYRRWGEIQIFFFNDFSYNKNRSHDDYPSNWKEVESLIDQF